MRRLPVSVLQCDARALLSFGSDVRALLTAVVNYVYGK